MQIPNDKKERPEAGNPENEEIHGLEETQATILPNSQDEDRPEINKASASAGAAGETPEAGGDAADADISPEHQPSQGETFRTVRLSDKPLVLPAEEGPPSESTAQTVRIAARKSPADESASIQAVESSIQPETPPVPQPSKPHRPRWLFISLLGLIVLGTIALLAGLGGYLSGIAMRQNAAQDQVAQTAKEQFDLGVQDIAQGNYFNARQRFEYVIEIDPAYPGAIEKLADVLLELNTTATPTLLPTQTVMPTADMRGAEDLFNQGKQLLVDGEWSKAIDALLQLRKTDPEFHKVEIDGMLFLALRHRGRDKILNENDLEGGIYDLTLAERFGVMDVEAQSLLNWSTAYITGASFWDLDWEQAAYYFGQVAPYAPNLTDKSMITARERYREALVQYAKQLLNQKAFCKAQEQLGIALSIVQDPEVQSGYDQAAQLCAGPPPPGEEPTQAP